MAEERTRTRGDRARRRRGLAPRPDLATEAPAVAATRRSRIVYWCLGGALLGLSLIWYRVLFLGETNVLRDSIALTLPAYDAVGAALRRGRLPQWWDALGFGATLAGNPMNHAISPVAWLFLPIPRVGADLFTLFHVAAGGLGAGLWAVRLGADRRGAAVAAALFTASGYVASVVSGNASAPNVAWLPWIGWASDRLAAADARRERILAACTLAALWSLQLVPGEPGHTITAGWLMVASLLARRGLRGWRTLGWAAASVGVAGLLAAAAVLPAVAHLGDSVRAGGLDLATATAWSMHPLRLLELVWPGALGVPLDGVRSLHYLLRGSTPDYLGPTWALSVHVGAGVLALAVIAAIGRRERVHVALLAATGGFLLLALGAHTPLYGAYRALFPPQQLMRYPEKHLAGAVTIWCALAGVGLSVAMAAPRPRWIRTLVAAAAGALLVAVALAVAAPTAGALLAGSVPSHVDLPETVRAIARGGTFTAASLGLLAAALALAGRGRSAVAAAVAAAALLAPLAFDGSRNVVTGTRDRLQSRPEVLDMILERDPGQRTGPYGLRIARGFSKVDVGGEWGEMLAAYDMETVAANVATRFGFGVFPGEDPGESARAERFAVATVGGDSLRIMKLLAIRWALANVPAGEELPAKPEVSLGRGWHLLRVTDGRPRAFVAPRWRSAEPGELVIDRLLAEERPPDLGRVAVVGLLPSPPDRALEPLTPCGIEASAPEEVRLLCASRMGGIAVLLDELAPGWSATLDGSPAELHLVDGLFRGVPVGPGAHVIELHYAAPGLKLGLVISLVAWLGLAALVSFQVRAVGGERPPPPGSVVP